MGRGRGGRRSVLSSAAQHCPAHVGMPWPRVGAHAPRGLSAEVLQPCPEKKRRCMQQTFGPLLIPRCGPTKRDPLPPPTVALVHTPQVCSYRCIASYESPKLADFSLCVLQKHNCLGLSAEIPMVGGKEGGGHSIFLKKRGKKVQFWCFFRTKGFGGWDGGGFRGAGGSCAAGRGRARLAYAWVGERAHTRAAGGLTASFFLQCWESS